MITKELKRVKYTELDFKQYLTKTRLKEAGLSSEGVEPYAEYFSRSGSKWVPVYDVDLCKKVEDIEKKPRKRRTEMTEEQRLIANEKRAKTSRFNKTCSSCRKTFEQKLKRDDFERPFCETCLLMFNVVNECSICYTKCENPSSLRKDHRICSSCSISLSKDTFRTQPAGTHHYEEAMKLVGELLNNEKSVKNAEVTFVRNPENPYDSNAIKILVNEIFIGYIERRLADFLAPILEFEADSLSGYLNVEYSSLEITIKIRKWDEIVKEIDLSKLYAIQYI